MKFSKKKRRGSIIRLAIISLVNACLLSSTISYADIFPNPIIEQRADPWVYKHDDGNYYFTASVPKYDRIIIRKSPTLAGLATTEEVTIWNQPASGPMSGFVWAPELHYVNGAWYIYYAASENNDIWDIRIYVLENTASDPTTGTWQEKGELKVPGHGNTSRYFALDATTFEHSNVQYLVWAQAAPGGESSLYIAEMTSPWSINQNTATLIAKPTYDWERQGFAVNEGPAVLKRNGRIFMTYSASATDRNYAIGLLTADENADLLDPDSWHKNSQPVFKTNDATSQYGPGHSSFTVSEDGTQDILIYHARDYADISGDSLYDPNRHTRGKVFTWNSDGTPNFGVPYANGVSGYTTLKSVNSMRCIDVFKWSTQNGSDIVQWDCNGFNVQNFALENLGNGYLIRSLHSKKCLDVMGQSKENGANVAQWSCWNGDNQRWTRETQSDGSVRFVNVHSGMCLDVVDASMEKGASLIQSSCNNSAQQSWLEQ
jgi:GH43 family beta-xylosidase